MNKFARAVFLLPCLFSAAAYAGGCPVVAARALYFITNNDENSVVAVRVHPNGTLSDGSVTMTGGAGGAGVTDMGEAAGPDPLFSQSVLALSNGKLVAVNPGSNSITLFDVDPMDPTVLTRVGEPVDTMGDFPSTVAISSKLSQAWVENSGARAGIACFVITPGGLQPLDSSPRVLNINQTTPPMGPLRTVSQVSFTEDSTQLIAFVKGNPPANVTGFMSVYPVQPDGLVSQTEIQSNPNGTAVLFGSIQIPGTPRWVATDASLGGALLEVNPSTGVASTIALSPIPDQNATCWATYSASTDTVYVTDINENRLVGIDPATGELDMNVVALDNGSKGMIDLVAAGDFVYALSVGGERATIVVLDLSDGKDGVKFTQNFQPEGMIDVLKVQGLALCE